MPTRQGSFHLFKLFGINVYLHWSWFLVAIYEVETRKGLYSSVSWNVLEYLTLFLIVLTHEFGHSLACRSVGGQANQIVLWPFGGVAYVSPPQRPGAMLWSIVAGPLVNVILFPILTALWWFGGSAWGENLGQYIETVWYINLALLIFNIMPIYPLDGGKILYAVLWFILGQARSLMVATVVGFIGIAGLFVLAILKCLVALQSGIWLGLICVFIFFNCLQGFKYARQLIRISKAPRRDGYRCPVCQAVPPIGDFWTCGKCRKKFDAMETHLVCPHCSTQYARVACQDCGTAHSAEQWLPQQPVQSGPPGS